MKSYCNFRYLFLAAFTSFCIGINAQTGGSITATSELSKGDSGYDVVSNMYGISGSKITTKISVNKPTLTLRQIITDSETKYYRIYNNETTQITLQSNSDKDFKPEVGRDQTLKYRVVFTIKETGKDDITYPLESEEFSFSIYESEGYSLSFSKQPEGAEKNTYAGRDKDVEYSVNFADNDKILPPYRIDWTINKDNQVVKTGNSYSFNPSNLDNTEKKEYTFTSTVKFLKPATNDVWFEGSEGSNVTSDQLSVYPKQPEVDANEVLQGPTNVTENTTHNGVECKYEVDIKQNEYNKYGKLKYTWSNNNQQQTGFTSNEYQYTPSVSKKEEHTIHVKVACVNPADDKDEWYSFVDNDFEPLTVCLNPETININEHISFPADNGKGRVNTYANRGNQGNQVYKVEIPYANDYGTWLYEWTRTFKNDEANNTKKISEADASFNPSESGTYTTKLSIKCVNPDDETDIWLENNEISIPNLIVYNNPYNIDFSNAFKYPTKEYLAEHTGTPDRSREYSVTLPDSADSCGKWVYQWMRNKAKVSETESANIPNNIGEGTYTTSLVLKCVDPDTNEEWCNVDVPTFPSYVVYPEPNCTINNLHQDPNDKETEYAMYVGQTFDASELISTSGGCEGGWKKELFIDDDDKKEESFSFTPKDVKRYSLKLKVTNEALLSDESGKKMLFENEEIFTFNVLENPYQSIKYYLDSNSNNKEYVKDTIHVEQGHKLNLCSESFTFNWNLKDSNGRYVNDCEDSENTFTWKCINSTQSDTQPSEYTLTCEVKTTPDHFVKGLQNREIKILVWKKIGITINSLTFVDSEDNSDLKECYVLETCKGLMKNGEIVTVTSVGGAWYNWKLPIWDANDNTIPKPVVTWDTKDTNWRTFKITFNNLEANNDGSSRTYYYKFNSKFNNKDNPFTIAIIVWPKPEIKSVKATLKENILNPQTDGINYNVKTSGTNNEIMGECYKNDVIQMQCELAGGSQNWQGWEYKFDNKNNTNSMQDSIISHCFDSHGNKTTDYFQIFYYYKGKYYTSNEEWYSSDKYRFNFNVYETPTCKPNLTDSAGVKWGNDIVDVYAGGIPISVDDFQTQGGNLNGWIVNDSVNSDNSGSTVTYKLHVENKIGYNVGYKKDFEYRIRLWKKVEFSDLKFTDVTQMRDMTNQLAIREGNTMRASITPMQYGYTGTDNSYIYDCNWPNFSSDNGLNCPDYTVSSINNDNMEFRTDTFTLKMDNMGPYGNKWDSKTITYEVKVYNKPETPASIIQKGSGASGTMIATTNVSDKDLEGRKYYLVFGYTDENGKDHDFASQEQKEVGQVRFSSQFKDEQQRAKAYVYALWKYPDGVEITSGKRMRSDVDENYDSSTYNGTTRAVIGGDNADVIETIKNTSDVRYVYTLDGIRVGSTLSGLKPGFYIVEYTDGVTNKISVK